jgi:hypothetical protein
MTIDLRNALVGGGRDGRTYLKIIKSKVEDFG